ncbi:MAG TPA: sn-glycerol-3-phosphate ABC transporter ATP-binding protein UgpC [Chloroflexota bacterium]|nr:sn-glycerol-3-phosphate ABC transporter ATP-binding protein UgpC [Chloroflexota bacterium]
MAQVALDQVSKRFGDVTAVNDVTLEARDKEFLVLVGPSGCGKTTTLRMVAGLDDISSGRITIGDRVVNNLSPKDRDIAMVFQSYALYPHMNVYNNMAFGLKLRKTPKAEINRRVQEAARTLDIEPLLKRKPKELSGGQRQRVALGRAIVREPAVFLMDEPLSNLDAMLRVQTRKMLITLHRRLETTVIYVTHDQTEAMTMGTRIAVMNAGNLQQVDAPQTLYDYPVNTFVATFIGSPQMNMIDGSIVEQSGEIYFQAAGISLKLPPAMASLVKSSGAEQVSLGIRPEHIEPVFNASNGSASMQAQVEVVEHMGAELYVYLQSGRETAITARFSAEHDFAPGNTIGVQFDENHLHLFDRTTGNAISHGASSAGPSA